MRNHIALIVGFSLFVGACDSGESRTIRGRDGGILVLDKDSGMTTVIYDGGTPPTADDLAFDRDAFFITDPPPKYCAIDGGNFTPPPLPTGTLDCPSDKNREGCPCPTEGMKAPCWPGARANRNLGICMDGTTVCKNFGEAGLFWDTCVGYVLPDPTATSGADACQCFSHGGWEIDNTSPCILTITDSSGTPQSYEAYSSKLNGTTIVCGDSSGNPAYPKPGETWSPDTVIADCAGNFTLCYQIKAGDAMNRKATDCIVGKSCVTGNYVTPGMKQTFPPMPTWHTTDSACIGQFAKTGGYWEMTVVGTSITCDTLPDHVFNFGGFCPSDCNGAPDGGTNPACANCSTMGSGIF
jgi:hypothetical protein